MHKLRKEGLQKHLQQIQARDEMINQYFEKDDMVTQAKYEKQKTNSVNRLAEKLEAIE